MEWLTTHEAAEILKLREQTLRAWRAKGKGPPWSRLEGSVRYSREEIDAWVQSRKAPQSGAQGA